MKKLSILFLLFSVSSFASTHEMKLTFIDAYNNQKIIDQEVELSIVKPSFKKQFITDNSGSITFSFDSENYIQYQFEFKNGDYELQIRERYFDEENNVEITFYVYPSQSYENRIYDQELKLLENYQEVTKKSNCKKPKFPGGDEAMQSFIFENVQTPSSLGDYGFEVKFKIEFVLGPDGKPYLIKILESSDEQMNCEAIRLLRAMPAWQVEDCSEKKLKRTIIIPVVIDLQMG